MCFWPHKVIQTGLLAKKLPVDGNANLGLEGSKALPPRLIQTYRIHPGWPLALKDLTGI